LSAEVGRDIRSFERAVRSSLGFSLRQYQRAVFESVADSVVRGERFVVVAMPTGSGKTLVEMLTAYHFMRRGKRVLVIEPTRFLCDQMHLRAWSKVFGPDVARSYDGSCSEFHGCEKVVISTPRTATKCVSELGAEFDAVIVDEVHHAFGSRSYTKLLASLGQGTVVGFTALLPRKRLYRLDDSVRRVLGDPLLLLYDYAKLRGIDESFELPKAIADVFEAEMSDLEGRAYNELFSGRVKGSSTAVKRLELALAKYGCRAMCESYERALSKGSVLRSGALDELCISRRYSHKARAVIEVLRAYNAARDEYLKPVLVLTSRVATAREVRDAVVSELGIDSGRVELLTGSVGKSRRLELVDEVRRGRIDVLVSTRVGEEGIDIPEAGLLVMLDVPKNPLRFYQRIGRLVRLRPRGSSSVAKYLVFVLTPRTAEVEDLSEALESLSMEGVDVSYIIESAGNDLVQRVCALLETASRKHGSIAIPLSKLATTSLSQIVGSAARSIMSDRELMEEAQRIAPRLGVDDLSSVSSVETLLLRLLSSFYAKTRRECRDIVKKVCSKVARGRLVESLCRAVKRGDVLYIYDSSLVAPLLADKIAVACRELSASGSSLPDTYFRIDTKCVAMMLSKFFPFEKLSAVLSDLRKRVRNLAAAVGMHEPYVRTTYNSKSRAMCAVSRASIPVPRSRFLEVIVQLNYYCIERGLWGSEQLKELVTLNVQDIVLSGISLFLSRRGSSGKEMGYAARW